MDSRERHMESADGFGVAPTPGLAIIAPPPTGRRVALRTIKPDDYSFILHLETEGERLIRWRHMGATPSPERALSNLWEGVIAQFLVVNAKGGAPVGLVNAYGMDGLNSNCHLGLIMLDEAGRRGLGLDAAMLFLRYVFTTWNMRKVYAEMIEFNFARLASNRNRLWNVEGQLREHYYYDGLWWDKYLLAIYRGQFEERWARYESLLLGRKSAGAEGGQRRAVNS